MIGILVTVGLMSGGSTLIKEGVKMIKIDPYQEFNKGVQDWENNWLPLF